MITVVISLFVQRYLTRNAKYPSLYEAQVISPTDSPAHKAEHLEAVLNRLRQKEVQVPPELVAQEAVRILSAGKTIPLPYGKAFSILRIGLASPANSKSLCDLGLMTDIQVVGVFQNGTVIFPSENYRLQSGDLLVVIAEEVELAGAQYHLFNNPDANSRD